MLAKNNNQIEKKIKNAKLIILGDNRTFKTWDIIFLFPTSLPTTHSFNIIQLFPHQPNVVRHTDNVIIKLCEDKSDASFALELKEAFG